MTKHKDNLLRKPRLFIIRCSIAIRNLGEWLYDTQVPNDYNSPTRCGHCGKWSFEPKDDTPND